MTHPDRYDILDKLLDELRHCPEEKFSEFFQETFRMVERVRAERGFYWKEGKVIK